MTAEEYFDKEFSADYNLKLNFYERFVKIMQGFAAIKCLELREDIHEKIIDDPDLDVIIIVDNTLTREL